MGQFRFDPLTSAAPDARLATRNKGSVNMEKYVKVTRSRRVDREKPKHTSRFEPYNTKGAGVEQRRQDWEQKRREEKYDLICVVNMFGSELTSVPRILIPPKATSDTKHIGLTTSTDVARKHLLSTLKDEKNPVAHSIAPLRAGV